MGGFGSGRQSSYTGKPATKASLPLDIRSLQRAGMLMPGRAGIWMWTYNDR